ncbi:MAG: glycosyltransferase family 39 protein [Candidatus Omnitrophota bacterium]
MKALTRHPLFVVLILLGVGLSFRVIDLTREYSGDETVTMLIAGSGLNNIVSVLKARSVYPPLTYFLLSGWMSLSQSIWWIRLYFVMFGLGVCMLIYLIGKECFNEGVARVALLLATFSPLLIFASQYVRSYGDSAFWMLLSTFFMLKIIKGSENLPYWIGYALSAVLAMLTFYFAMPLLFAQTLFIIIFKRTKPRFLLRWLSAICVASLIFCIWLPHAVSQFDNASSFTYNWADKGFNVGALRIGIYARNMAALAGFDPYFMTFHGGITGHFSKRVLGMLALVVFVSFGLFSLFTMAKLKARFPQKADLVWFLPFVSVAPLLISWLSASFIGLSPIPRYLAALHALFLILIAFFIHTIMTKNRFAGNTLLVFVLIVFAMRIPHAVSVEFGTASAVRFLQTQAIDKDECLLSFDPAPEINEVSNFVEVRKYFKLNDNRTEYVAASNDVWKQLKRKVSPFRRIWFYRVYGNAEVFGANQAIVDWISREGYRPIERKSFRNIDIIAYEKGNN